MTDKDTGSRETPKGGLLSRGTWLAVLGIAAGLLLLSGGWLFPEKSDRASSVPARTEEAWETEIAALIGRMEGAQSAEVLLMTDGNGTVTGAAAVVSGGSDPTVRERVIGLLCALLGLSSTHVFVSG